MFVRITRTGNRSYVKIVEAFRDDTGVSRQRVVATLGRLEHVRGGAPEFDTKSRKCLISLESGVAFWHYSAVSSLALVGTSSFKASKISRCTASSSLRPQACPLPGTVT